MWVRSAHMIAAPPSAAAAPPTPTPPPAAARRAVLLAAAAAAAAAALRPRPAAAEAAAEDVLELRRAALAAYSDRDFETTIRLVSRLVAAEPAEPRWLEMRAQALVDAKDFGGARRDFDAALAATPPGAPDRARLLAGRALAFEGESDWAAALGDYRAAQAAAAAAGQGPYVLNSIGNCEGALGHWAAAREAYLKSADGFQAAAGFRRGRSMSPRLDGAVFAASNAALALAQLGDTAGAAREAAAVARRAPGSADMRAALAALYWKMGDEAAAEGEWAFACTYITVGCSKYQDVDWLRRVRRWPPAVVEYLRDFLALRSSSSGGGAAAAAAPAGGSRFAE